MGWLFDRVAEDSDAFEERHACGITAMPSMLLVGFDIVGVIAGDDEPSLVEERDFTVHQSFHPFDAIHILEQHWTRRIPATGLRRVRWSYG
jgi:hypothetical protein